MVVCIGAAWEPSGASLIPKGRHKFFLMSSLNLKTTSAQYGGNWSDDDYVVLCDGQVIGRILLHPNGTAWAALVLVHQRA